MSKYIDESEIHLHNKRRAREVRITIEHIKRFKDIFKYAPDDPVGSITMEEWFDSAVEDGETSSGEKLYRSPELPKVQRLYYRKLSRLEEWHWEQIWDRIKRKGRGWWD